MTKLKKDSKCAIAKGHGWTLTIDAYHALSLQVPGSSSSFRQPKEKIKEWFMNDWAHVLLIKNEKQWVLYINSTLMLVANSKEEDSIEEPYLQFGDAQVNVFYGLQGKVSHVSVFDRALNYDQIFQINNKLSKMK